MELHRRLRHLRSLLSVLLFGAALWIVRHSLAGYQYRDVVHGLAMLSWQRIGLATLFTASSYLALAWCEALALRYIAHPLGWRGVATSAFVSNAFTNSVGLASLGGAPIRLRFLSAWGYSPLEVLQVVVFASLTRLVGFSALAGLIFLWQPVPLQSAFRPPLETLRPIGALCLLAVAAYLGWTIWRPASLRIGGTAFRAPRPSLAAEQLAASSLDWACSAAVLWALLGSFGAISFSQVLGAFLLAQASGYASSVPGGLGVFESVFLLLLPAGVPAAMGAAALLGFRVIYYLLPLGLSALLIVAQEIRERAGPIEQVRGSLQRAAGHVIPEVFALSSFAAGAILLFSGAAPAAAGRLKWLRYLLPLPVVEISHFLASLTGVGLLVLSRALHRRLDAAYVAAAVLLAAGAVLSLAKGFDYEETTILLAMLTALLPCRRHFYRVGSLLQVHPTHRWVAAVVIVIGASVWLFAFSHRHIEYAPQLWWQFAFKSEAPRSLRAMVGAVVAAAAIALVKLFGSPAERPTLPRDEDIARARAIAADSTNTYAYLALRRDKALLFGARGDAFLSYGGFDRSWVAMGDPIGPAREAVELAWRFCELCDRYGRWPVFFEVGSTYADLYLDLGLGLLKLGEEARIPLANFSLDGAAHAELRQTRSRLQRAGCEFEIIPSDRVPGIMADLRRVSDLWLAEKTTREKGFSNAAFSEPYLALFPAVVVRSGGQIVAFANLWLGAQREELSVDLMRFVPTAPAGVMDYLLTELMSWGREQGYRSFNLGMTPLAGLSADSDTPLWDKLATFVFRHGEHFYNFQGLRHYKAKFRPEWQPKFLASRGGLALPRILIDVTGLVSGGLVGIVAR